jgi:hypothetical protein
MTLSAPRRASFPASPVDWCEWFVVSLARADREQAVQDLTVNSFPLQQPAPVLFSPHGLSPFGDPGNTPIDPCWPALPLLPILRAYQSP